MAIMDSRPEVGHVPLVPYGCLDNFRLERQSVAVLGVGGFRMSESKFIDAGQTMIALGDSGCDNSIYADAAIIICGLTVERGSVVHSNLVKLFDLMAERFRRGFE